MRVRMCAGGVVFYEDLVLILKNDKDEWVLPKGVVRNGDLSRDVALERVRVEAGVEAEIVSTAGETSYEFYSMTRRQPVYNQITWYVMQAKEMRTDPDARQGFQESGFYTFDEAIDKITYSQDKALVAASFRKYRKIAS
ncbi:MAG: NUDIX domain-containing protein [Christensenellales bacterium]